MRRGLTIHRKNRIKVLLAKLGLTKIGSGKRQARIKPAIEALGKI